MKNIILISPDTFGYYKEISKAISRKGFNPIWLNQLPTTSTLGRIIFRLFPRIVQPWADKHFTKELKKFNNIERIIIIKGEGISEALISKMREFHSDAKIILYLWDSLANTPGANSKIHLCDASFSFDPIDCEFNKKLEHLPLFYSKKCESNSNIPGSSAFIGTLHSNRYNLIKELASDIEKITKIKSFLYFYHPNKMLFLIMKIMKKSFRKINTSEIHFKPIPRDQFEKVQSTSEIAIDICHPKQSGLTMRSIEALGAGKKLITNNKSIKKYDFYQPENHYVIDNNSKEEFSYFLKSKYQSSKSSILEKYYIDVWLLTLLKAGNA